MRLGASRQGEDRGVGAVRGDEPDDFPAGIDESGPRAASGARRRPRPTTPTQSAATTGDGPTDTAPTSAGTPDWVRYEYLLSRTGTARRAKMLSIKQQRGNRGWRSSGYRSPETAAPGRTSPPSESVLL